MPSNFALFGVNTNVHVTNGRNHLEIQPKKGKRLRQIKDISSSAARPRANASRTVNFLDITNTPGRDGTNIGAVED